jgi:hypothetical protein
MPPPRQTAADPGQLTLSFHVPMSVIPQGDGSVLLRPGKPTEWMTVGQFAAAVGLHRNTVYPYIGSEDLPERFVQYTGPRRIRISAAAVAHWQDRWKTARGLAGPGS